MGRKNKSFNTLDRFLSFVKMKLISYRGINAEDFHYYLLNLHLRYNLGEESLYQYLVGKLRVVETPTSSENSNSLNKNCDKNMTITHPIRSNTSYR
ncbi:MAG: hypothetical protein A2V93_03890 [Ignavibacteria bacterium RBG_16_34_14]|nr:MAG: hypothetical protein A2V93_03890 [Ignavibacteria bacterium RBG_16_34_14]